MGAGKPYVLSEASAGASGPASSGSLSGQAIASPNMRIISSRRARTVASISSLERTSGFVSAVAVVTSWVASVVGVAPLEADDWKCAISGSRSVFSAVDRERTSLRRRSTS